MQKVLFISLICYFLGSLIKSQNTNQTNPTVTCDITAYNETCYGNNINCAFVESQKDVNKYFACLAVRPKDCNFFCNYFNELNTAGGIKSLFCICNGIKYPNNERSINSG